MGLLTLEERRHQADMVQTYKIVTGSIADPDPSPNPDPSYPCVLGLLDPDPDPLVRDSSTIKQK